MERSERIKRIAVAGFAGVVVTFGSTWTGYKFGAKHGSPWLGALGGFFVLAPVISYPLTTLIAGEALVEMAEEARAERLRASPAAGTER